MAGGEGEPTKPLKKRKKRSYSCLNGTEPATLRTVWALVLALSCEPPGLPA